MLQPGQFHFFNTDGALVRADVTIKLVASPEDTLKRLSEENRIYIRSAFKALGIPANVTVSGTKTWVTVKLPFIRITSEYLPPDPSGICTPAFTASGTGTKLSADWAVPKSMRAVLLFEVSGAEGVAAMARRDSVYLAAFDSDGRAYRLPLPNTYDDSRLCTGWSENEIPCDSIQEAASIVVDRFLAAPWNSDLFKTKSQAASMFRFKAESSGLVTILDPSHDNWKPHALKLAAPHLNNVCL